MLFIFICVDVLGLTPATVEFNAGSLSSVKQRRTLDVEPVGSVIPEVPNVYDVSLS